MDKLFLLLGNLSSIFGVISGLYFFYQYFYNRKIKFYLWINRFFSGRREVHFKLSLSFRYTADDFFKKFEDVAKRRNLRFHREMNMKNHKMYNFEGTIIDLAQNDLIDNNPDEKNVFIRVIDAGVTLKTGIRIITMFGKIMTDLCIELNIQDQDYNFEVLYDYRENPFVGMKLKTLSRNNLLNFYCKINYCKLLDEKMQDDTKTIDIYKRNVSVNDDNYSDLGEVAKILLTV